MSEFKPDHSAILKPRQLVKEITYRLFQLEVISAGDLGATFLAAQSRDVHYLYVMVENWLSSSNRQVLNTAELLLAHDLHQ